MASELWLDAGWQDFYKHSYPLEIAGNRRPLHLKNKRSGTVVLYE